VLGLAYPLAAVIVMDQEPVACTFTSVYFPAATAACPLVVLCPCTASWVGSVELLVTVNVVVAHPGHCHLSCEAAGTVSVPSDPLPEPLKVCGGAPVVDDPLETVDVVVVVLVTVRVVVERTTRGGCLTITVLPAVVTVLAGVLTVFTRVTDNA
jgi:hypothetical protein